MMHGTTNIMLVVSTFSYVTINKEFCYLAWRPIW